MTPAKPFERDLGRKAPQIARELAHVGDLLRAGRLLDALRYLNGRTPHRFSAVLRFDDDMLRSVALVDKWHGEVELGEDIPLADAYCAHLHATGDPLEVADGRRDPRTPWMSQSPVVSYCGAVICDESGEPWGALCHYDTNPCEAKASDMPLLTAAAALMHHCAVNWAGARPSI